MPLDENKPTRFTLDDLDNTEQDRIRGRTRNPIVNNNRIEYTFNRLTKMVDDRGINVYWEKSYFCTCRNKMTNAPNPACPYCHGRGISYLEPVQTKLVIQKQKLDEQNTYYGLFSSGTAVATTYPNTLITFRDRITLPDVIISNSLIFDVNEYRVNKGFWMPYNVKNITLAVTEDNQRLAEDVDYTYVPGSNIIRPFEHLIGKNISINVNTVLRYMVADLLKESRYQYTDHQKYQGDPSDEAIFDDLPRKILLQREEAWINHFPMIGDKNPEDVSVFKEEEPNSDPRGPSGFFGG